MKYTTEQQEYLNKGIAFLKRGTGRLERHMCKKHIGVCKDTLASKFGSWVNYQELIGQLPGRNPSADLLLKLGKEYFSKNNKLLRDEAKEKLGYSYVVFVKKFGSWGDYLNKVNKNYMYKTKNITNDALVELGKEYCKNNKTRLTKTNAIEKLGYAGDTIAKRFKTWNTFSKLIGQEPIERQKPIVPYHMSKKKIAELGKEYIKKYDKRICTKDVKKHLKVSINTVRRRFGSWKNFQKVIGQPIHDPLYGIPTIALDNYKYSSIAEAEFVDRYLYNKFEYKRQVYYKDFLDTNRMFTCDFWVKGIGYIEVYSITCTNAEKKALAESQGVKIYWISSRDVFKCNTLEDILKMEHKELK